ncbi:hypothetical protein P8923_11995 [Bacillus atrophaeus]|uniref:hypothetical protein n=1 Tax=Bacillus atrophaeus TaxID=1452 RepID=UPI002DB896C5|nr:hypothetical protein [Bacillus atrophaeus]MEC0991640.1 hypothetical protein [Bacillus atrophaeus]
MMLGQNIVSLNYIKDAMHIYKRNENYKKKLAISMMVVGHNYTELGQFDKAEEIKSILKQLGYRKSWMISSLMQ